MNGSQTATIELDPKTATAALGPSDRSLKLILAALAGITGVFSVTAIYQMQQGHVVQGLGTQGAIWGVIVANIVNLIGISHVGIAISAFVRIMNLKRYKQLARLAEILTVAALTTAVINIGLDVGRPDRFIINVVWYGRWHSPFVWSMTVITAYFLATGVYLYLAMRRDLALCAQLFPKRRRLFQWLALGYTDTEEERKLHERTIWWVAVLIVPIMVSVHSVYGLIFGLQAGRAGWYNPFMAPYFVLGAVVSGFSAMILVVAALRKIFHWESVFPPYVFRGLGSFLCFMTLLYIYFMLAETLTGQFAAPEKEGAVFTELLWGRFTWHYWLTFLGGLVVPFLLLFIQWTRKPAVSIALTVGCALAINVSMWVVRSLIVVPTFYHPLLPYQPAAYSPSWVEWTLVFGSYGFAALLYLALCKLVPVLELPSELSLETPREASLALPRWRKALVYGTLVAGIALIGLGIINRQLVPASFVWVLGIACLTSVPLQICLRPVTRAAVPRAAVQPFAADGSRAGGP